MPKSCAELRWLMHCVPSHCAESSIIKGTVCKILSLVPGMRWCVSAGHQPKASAFYDPEMGQKSTRFHIIIVDSKRQIVLNNRG